MLRLIALIVGAFALATGLVWLADRPGSLVLNWQGYEVETSVFRAVVILTLLVGFSVFAWNLLKQIWLSPAVIGNLFNRRRQKRGLEALSTGLIALGAGDKQTALRYAVQARRTLPNEPLTHLLRAQAARLAGDKITARRIFEAMLSAPDTEQLGLRGLFLEAESEGETEAARQFAERALRVNPKLGWAVDSLFELQCKQKDWPAAIDTIVLARKNGHLDKVTADRRRAVLLTAQAQTAEDSEPERALNLALEAHGLAVDLVPAAAIAGRLLASKGNTPRATKIIQETWRKSQHPDLAVAYAFARIGDSPRDRLMRVKQLASLAPMSIESPIALATAAIEAKDWEEARAALMPLTEGRLTQRVCTLMARVEGAEHGDKGRVREWLARAVNAPRDPAWTADGIVSETWQPVSPVTGALDAFQWRVPLEQHEKRDADLIAEKLEELVALGAPREVVLDEVTKVIEVKVADPAGRPSAEHKSDARDTVASAPPSGSAARSRSTAAEPIEAEPVSSPRTAPDAKTNGDRSRSQAAESEVVVVTKPVPAARVAVTADANAEPPVAAAARAAAAASAPASQAAPKKPEVKSAATAVQAGMDDSVGVSATARKDGAPKMYVAPRAPDDPGLDKDAEHRASAIQPRRVS
jgi:HemY protein